MMEIDHPFTKWLREVILWMYKQCWRETDADGNPVPETPEVSGMGQFPELDPVWPRIDVSTYSVGEHSHLGARGNVNRHGTSDKALWDQRC